MNDEKVIKQLVEEGNWLALSNMFRILDPSFIMEHAYCFAWGMITELYQLDEDELERYCGYWISNTWKNACQYQKMSEQFLRNHIRDLDWNIVCHYQRLSEGFMTDYWDHLDWPVVSHYQYMSPKFLEDFDEYVWWELLNLDYYDELFVIKHVDKIGWSNLTSRKQFSESIIREYYDEMSWGELSSNQYMSENFIREFENDITFNYLLVNPNCHFGKKFISQYIHKIGRTTWKSQKYNIIKKYGLEFWDKYAKHFGV